MSVLYTPFSKLFFYCRYTTIVFLFIGTIVNSTSSHLSHKPYISRLEIVFAVGNNIASPDTLLRTLINLQRLVSQLILSIHLFRALADSK